MALCPLCQSDKPFFAPRCRSCNANIGFMHQLIGMIIYFGVIIIGVLFGLHYGLIWLTSL
jgi:hypothetical protein